MDDHHSTPPKFTDLPFYRDTMERHAWGVFGADDQLGTLNLLTPERVKAATAEISTGDWFSLNWKMEYPDPAFFTRHAPQFRHIDLAELHTGSDDVYDHYYSQSSTQWDALNHVGTLSNELYNGNTPESVHDAGQYLLGIQHSGRRGIAGRYSLIDVAGWWRSEGRAVDLGERVDITSADLDAALAAQGSEVRPGDIVLVHTGWTRWYGEQSEARQRELGEASTRFQCPFPGLAPSVDTVAWLWDHQVAAIVTDTPAVESGPFTLGSYDTFLHYRLIGLMGFTLGEMFYLADLARACESDRRYGGLLVAAPFNKAGGAGSPGNAVAIR